MAGGQATNAGINYQQRIAAWFLINQYSEFDISAYFDQFDEELIIEKVHFETSQPIDDLNLECRNHKFLFLQIKRSLSLSTKDTSEFYKTIDQFVHEFIKNENTQNFYGLITTSDASSKITNDLKKIVASVRLNNDAFSENPLNESEQDTLEKLEIAFNKVYERQKGRKPLRDIFNAFAKRLFVGIINIETGHTVEIASFMLLKSIGFKRPELIWAILIKNSLIYASGRLSIDNQKLKKILNRYLDNEKNKSPEENQIEFLKTEIISQGEFQTGKEVLLIDSFTDELDYMIVELYRFKDDCQMKNIFYNNKIRIGNGDEWTVVQRFATISGFKRYFEENQTKYKGKKLAIIPANDIDSVEETECSKLHRTLLEALVDKNENPILCLHCDKAISDKDALLVEVEDRETSPAVGNVHKDCLRPIDRILGRIKMPGREVNSNLELFDYKLWVSLILKGQGMLNALKSSPELFNGRSPIISWNSKEEYDTDYSYCIKFNLVDGSTSYAYQRSKIERVNKLKAEEYLNLFIETQRKQKEKSDPLCILSLNKITAPYSELLKIKKRDEVILEIVSVEIAKYSKLIAKVFDKDIFYYAPLCLVRDKETETVINLSNVVPIVSDPMQFDELFENWKSLGFGFNQIELKIIKSDKDFDNYMRIFFGDGLTPIIDPVFDKNFKLVKGYPINEYNQMIEEMEKINKDKK